MDEATKRKMLEVLAEWARMEGVYEGVRKAARGRKDYTGAARAEGSRRAYGTCVGMMTKLLSEVLVTRVETASR